jgi:hypothetical protein
MDQAVVQRVARDVGRDLESGVWDERTATSARSKHSTPGFG